MKCNISNELSLSLSLTVDKSISKAARIISVPFRNVFFFFLGAVLNFEQARVCCRKRGVTDLENDRAKEWVNEEPMVWLGQYFFFFF